MTDFGGLIRFVYDIFVICHVFMHFLGSCLLQDMFFSLQVFPFAGQNMKFTVKALLTCILYCDTGPGCDYRTVCKYRRLIFITDIIFVLVRSVRHRSVEKAIRFSRNILMFLAAIWSSSCFSTSMYRFYRLFLLLVVLARHDSNVAVYAQVCWLFCVLFLPLFGLAQARPWFRSSMWISSVAGISKILCTSVVASGTRTYVRM